MSPLRVILALLLLGFPLLEMAVLVLVGRAIGFWPTLGLLVLSAAAGMTIIRNQGVSMVGRMFDTIGRGGLAFVSMIDSYVVILAGCLLMVPGFITDAIGLALLVPPLRRLIVGVVLPGFTEARHDDKAGRAGQDRSPEAKRPIIIEGTYRRLDDEDAGH